MFGPTNERAHIQAVSIGERAIEIIYIEPRDQGKRVMVARTIQFDKLDVEEAFIEFEDSLHELLDAALLVKRQDEAAS